MFEDHFDLHKNTSASVSEALHYALTHVFFPVELPNQDDYSLEKNIPLVGAVCTAAHAYGVHVPKDFQPQWRRITSMLDKLQASLKREHLDATPIVTELRGMQTGDIVTFFVRRQNAAVMLIKRENSILFESFEVSPREDAVERASGSLLCSYPSSAIELSKQVFDDRDFQFEFADFLSLPNAVDPSLPSPPVAHPQYITALLSGILRSLGRAADVLSITKRIRDHVGRSQQNNRTVEDERVWRRSPLWLLIRIAMQMCTERSPLGIASYKRFLLFFMCMFASDARDQRLSSDLLHLMESKILRRLSKLGSVSTDWLSEMALKTCASLREVLDARWMHLQSVHSRPSPFRNPSQEELARDMELKLLGSREYIENALANRRSKAQPIPFHPNHRPRGIINNFLSPDSANFLEDAYDADPDTTLYDIEKAVEQELDEWFSNVVDVDNACAQLEILMDQYLVKAFLRWNGSPEDSSIMVLTALELFVALDKLVVKEIPMLADYSPELPITLLETLLLRKGLSLHRLSRVYQYLSFRHSQSRPGWSMLSDEFTKDSFPVRYYDQSSYLQRVSAHIDRCTMESFPISPLHAKVVIFELQCPSCIRIWRSAAPRIIHHLGNQDYTFRRDSKLQRHNLLAHNHVLQPYFDHHERISLSVQIHFACYDPEELHKSRSGPTLHYAIQYFHFKEEYVPSEGDNGATVDSRDCFAIWRQRDAHDEYLYKLTYRLEKHDDCTSCDSLAKYVKHTSHTSNDALAAQENCPVDLSLDEFVTFTHLRSGGSLQWINILQGLRSRTINFRRHYVHYLLSQAVFQVGPLDLNTGTWIWHQELQDTSFCDALLDELDKLFAEVGAGSIDGIMMNTISLLLTRILESSPSESVLGRAIALLRNVRRRTFVWVQELSYNLAKAPINKERSDLLLDMVATCQSTFDINSITLHSLCRSAEDVDTALSSTLFVPALRPRRLYIRDQYSILLLQRSRRLSFVLEDVLGDTILADVSDYGVDLAVCKVFAGHKPSSHRWERLQYPNSRWFGCRSKVAKGQPLQMVHFNLLDGALRAAGQPIGGLPQATRGDPVYREIFRDQGFFVIPSNLPEMDFTTLTAMSEHKVHFSLRHDYLVVRAHSSQSKDILELIPPTKLVDDLPLSLVLNHAHWLNLSSKHIEIRPLKRVWEQSSAHWRIDCASRPWRMYKGHDILLDIRSPTWEMVLKCFECLSFEIMSPGYQTGNIFIVATPSDPLQPEPVFRLSVTLPRSGLQFYANADGELESRDFKNMVYDGNQCLGALFGLENILVFRQKAHITEGLVLQRILIPNGSFVKRDNHRVLLDNKYHPMDNESDEPLYYIYDVDPELGCIAGNGSWGSTRHLARLHAMTTYDRPDPLTGQTGAQAALDLFQSSRCQSIMKHKSSEIIIWNWETHYPQLRAAHSRVRDHYFIKCYLGGEEVIGTADQQAMQRAAYLFPPRSAKFKFRSFYGCEYANYPRLESDLELERAVFATASAVQQLSNDAPVNIVSDWAVIWTGGDGTLADVASSPFLPEILEERSENLKIVQKLYDMLEKKNCTTRRSFQLLFLLPAMAYCSPCHHAAFLSMLIMFASRLDSQFLQNPPIHFGFTISDGYRPTDEIIRRHFRKARLRPEELYLYSEIEKHMADNTARDLLKDWPLDAIPGTFKLCWLPDSDLWDVASLTTSIQRLFSSCYCNLQLKEKLVRVITGPQSYTPLHPVLSPQRPLDTRVSWQITLHQLLSNRPVPLLPPRVCLPHHDNHRASSNDGASQLNQLLHSVSNQKFNSLLKREYVAVLQKSAQCLREECSTTQSSLEDGIHTFEKYYTRCRQSYWDALNTLKKVLSPTNDLQKALSFSGQWPPITGDALLRCLASTSSESLPQQWKTCLISLALLLLDLQRARRLLQFALDGLEEELSKELENEGCDGWNPEEFPDWLLIQIQGNFLIRRSQAEVAMEMISPRSGENTVMQINMGEGKSSVIIPIVAAALANGKQLIRVVVPKALVVQMFDLLVSRLCGLADRPIFYIPFSRSVESTGNGFQSQLTFSIDDMQTIMQRCMAECGIFLVLPEHIVSLKLVSIEKQIHNDKSVARAVPNIQKLMHRHIETVLSHNLFPEGGLVGDMFRWLRKSSNCWSKMAELHDESVNAGDGLDHASKCLALQQWLHSHARDILDESDEILHARFRLIYTIGLPQHIDGYFYRWTITQHVLRLVKKHILTLSKYASELVEYESGPPGSFPRIHVLQPSDVGRHLVSSIVEDVMAGQLPIFKFQGVSSALQDAIRSFISDEDVLQVPATVKKVEEYANLFSQQVWNGLLLLRGLLSSNVLLFSLAERRWRVDYGLIPTARYPSYSSTHTMLAVPYRAKDLPALNTHFGHPDITIILTCLSYYYGGLNEKQLREAFETLLDEDDPSTEYAIWIKEYDSGSLPDSLQTLGEINLRSSEQWDKIVYPLFSRNQGAIDFYLSRVVFPHEMKEYPWKLCASSWDLAEKRECLITGFSGTNDSRWLLPMSITQRDLDHQQATNARVLAYLLQPENESYAVTHESGESRSTIGFLRMIVMQEPQIGVLLDVGAQILDFSNLQVAREWLSMTGTASGAVYFSENDELMILMQSGSSMPLLSSSFSHQLDRCVVYLDHAHTRGTDIKLPIGSRAAVTLGSRVTKDHLVQGCMRMRKLGFGHSVMFFAPPEVDRGIRFVSGKEDSNTRITTVDVLSWAINETWTDIQNRAPYWAQQGMNHKSRYGAWSDYANKKLTREKLANVWLQPDHKSLTDLYAPSEAKNASHSPSNLDPEIRQRLKNIGVLSLPNAEMAEEQEREINREQEREREVELPPRAEPLKHYLHPDVVEFVNTGNLSGTSVAFRPVFTTLERSSAATVEANVWSPFILATVDFCQTIKPESTQGTIDQYIRPVQWILSRRKSRNPLLVLLSPYEANSLLPDIRASEHVHLHVYASRTSQRMKSSDDLTLYTIPPLPSDWTPNWTLIDQLNVFAGQLYLRDYDSYLRLCHFLGIPANELRGDAGVRWNMFSIPGSIEENEIRFSNSPLPSVMALLSIRRRGRPFERTHMGQILQGHLMLAKDFGESESRSAISSPIVATHDESTRQNPTLETLNSSRMDVGFCTAEAPGSMLLRSHKRRMETDEIPDSNAKPPKKRTRAGE